MSSNGSRAMDAGMLVCAVVLTGFVLRSELAPPRAVKPDAPVVIADWAALQNGGHRIGPAGAPVTIVEFSDFQCPYCAKFANDVLAPMRRLHPGEFSLIYRHWPLSIHPFAFDAAEASECAARLGKFDSFHDALFEDQESIGAKSFEQFAIAAGIADTSSFKRCLAGSDVSATVDGDRRLARSLNSGGTPSFVVNGLLLRAPLDSARLDSIIRAALRSSRADRLQTIRDE